MGPVSKAKQLEVLTKDFDSWYRSAHPRMLRALLVVSGERLAAEDVVAEAFTRALEDWDRVSTMTSPDGWTYRVAVNLLRRRWRRRAMEERLWRRRADPDVAPSATVPDPELWNVVLSLPPREREAIALRYAAGLKEREVAESMGITEGAASAALSSARHRLARLLFDDKTEEATNVDA
jgi:RNA polymerase sigma-70 factor (ECF subfamily)